MTETHKLHAHGLSDYRQEVQDPVKLINYVNSTSQFVRELRRVQYSNGRVMRDVIARGIAQDVSVLIGRGELQNWELEAEMGKIHTKLALLHALGGSLFKDRSAINEQVQSIPSQLRQGYVQRDLLWLQQLPFVMGWLNLDNEAARANASDVLNRTSGIYNNLIAQIPQFGITYEAIDRALESDSPLVIEVSQGMLERDGYLSGPEQSSLNLILGLSHRLRQIKEDKRPPVVFLVDGKRVAGSSASFLNLIAQRLKVNTSELDTLAHGQLVHFSDMEGFAETLSPSQPMVLHASVLVKYLNDRLGITSANKIKVFGLDLDSRQWDWVGVQDLIAIILLLAKDTVQYLNVEDSIKGFQLSAVAA
jgi:hypothetical protein